MKKIFMVLSLIMSFSSVAAEEIKIFCNDESENHIYASIEAIELNDGTIGLKTGNFTHNFLNVDFICKGYNSRSQCVGLDHSMSLYRFYFDIKDEQIKLKWSGRGRGTLVCSKG